MAVEAAVRVYPPYRFGILTLCRGFHFADHRWDTCLGSEGVVSERRAMCDVISPVRPFAICMISPAILHAIRRDGRVDRVGLPSSGGKVSCGAVARGTRRLGARADSHLKAGRVRVGLHT